MPYARWEDMDVASDDPVFGAMVPSHEAIVAGVRYDFDPAAALRAEYRNEEFPGGALRDSLYLQASFVISRQEE